MLSKAPSRHKQQPANTCASRRRSKISSDMMRQKKGVKKEAKNLKMADIIGWKRGGGGCSIQVVEMVKVEQVVIAWGWRTTEKRLGNGTRIKESLDKRWRNEFASNQLRRYNLQRWLAGLVPAPYSANPTNTLLIDREKNAASRSETQSSKSKSENENHKGLCCSNLKILISFYLDFTPKKKKNMVNNRNGMVVMRCVTGREESGRRWWMQTQMKPPPRLSMPISS